MNKKTASMLIVGIIIVSMLSFTASAASFKDFFSKGLSPIEDFFKGGWMKYEKTVAFLMFFFLFFSAYLIGMKTAFKEMTRPHYVFAFAAAFLSAFIIVITMKFNIVSLKYIAWILLIAIIFFLIYLLLGKLGLENHKFWLFLLALALTALLIWLIWWLMNQEADFSSFGRLVDRIGDWIDGLGKGGGDGAHPAGGAPETPPGTPPGEPGKPGGGGGNEPTKSFFDKIPGKGYLWLVITLVLVLVGGVIFFGRNKKEEEQKRINKLINNKKSIIAKIKSIEDKKEKVIKDMGELKKALSKIREGDLARLMDERRDVGEELKDVREELAKLIEYEKAIEDLIKHLYLVEMHVRRDVTAAKSLKINPELKANFDKIISDIEANLEPIFRILSGFLEIKEEEIRNEAMLKKLLGKEYLQERVKDKWLMIVNKEEDVIINLFNEEHSKFKEALELVHKEIDYLNQLSELLEKNQAPEQHAIGSKIETELEEMKRIHDAFGDVFGKGLANQTRLANSCNEMLKLIEIITTIDPQIKELSGELNAKDTQKKGEWLKEKERALILIISKLAEMKIFLNNENIIDGWIEKHKLLIKKFEALAEDAEIKESEEYLRKIPQFDSSEANKKIAELTSKVAEYMRHLPEITDEITEAIREYNETNEGTKQILGVLNDTLQDEVPNAAESESADESLPLAVRIARHYIESEEEIGIIEGIKNVLSELFVSTEKGIGIKKKLGILLNTNEIEVMIQKVHERNELVKLRIESNIIKVKEIKEKLKE